MNKQSRTASRDSDEKLAGFSEESPSNFVGFSSATALDEINGEELSIGRIREIEQSKFLDVHGKEVSRNGASLLQYLRSSWFGHFYLARLKRYSIIQNLVIWIWRKGYPQYLRYVAFPVHQVRFFFDKKRRRLLRWRKLLKHSEYQLNLNAKVTLLSFPSEVITPAPLSFPVDARKHLLPPHESYIFPEIFVTEVPQAIIYGGTNLSLVGDVVLCHDLYDFLHDATFEELHGRISIDAKAKKIRWLLHDELPESLPRAAIFTDAVAPNYAHWITEVLPRIAMFCAETAYSDVPLVVNAGLHPNLMASLVLMAGAQREIVCLPTGRAIFVESLYLTSACGYVPFERRNTKLLGHSHGMFSPVALEAVHSTLVEVAKQQKCLNFPDRVYLRRTAGIRKVINIDELENILIENGFGVVEPEKLSFLEQVHLFANAKIVVGSSGAALANLIFCHPEVKIFIMISESKNTSYWYWQNMACATGKKVSYIFGCPEKKYKRGIHADFYVDSDMFKKVLTEATR